MGMDDAGFWFLPSNSQNGIVGNNLLLDSEVENRGQDVQFLQKRIGRDPSFPSLADVLQYLPWIDCSKGDCLEIRLEVIVERLFIPLTMEDYGRI